LSSIAFAQTCPKPPSSPARTGYTHYVSTSGSDPASCPAWGANFRTLTRAAACAKPGDTIYVRAGWYTERPFIRAVGTASAPITIAPYPGDKVTFDGAGKVPNYEAVVAFYASFYVNFSGFEVAYTGTPSPQLGGYGISVTDSAFLNISKNKVHDTARNGITANGCHINFEENDIYNTSLRNAFQKSTSHDAAAASWVQVGNGQPSYNINWINNHIHDSWGECLIVLHLDTSTVTGNNIHDCFGVNLYVDGSRNVNVNGNYIYATGEKYNRTGLGRAAGIMLAVEDYTGNQHVKYQRYYLNRITISNNIIGGLSLGIRYWNSYYNHPANNYGNIVISNNVIKDIAETPIRFDAGPNNPDWGNAIRNNIIYSSYKSVQFNVAHTNVFEITNNLFPNGLPRGFEGNNLAGDPRLVDPVIGRSSAGFRLNSNSPAIRKGKVDAKVAADFWGARRSTSTPSIGIHEPPVNSSQAFPSAVSTSSLPHWVVQQGSNGDDYVDAAVADHMGNVLVAGYTTGSYAYGNQGGMDVMIAKYNGNGSLVWNRQLGSSGQERPYGLAVDQHGNAFVAGATTGSLTNAFKGGTYDGFLARYDADGTRKWSINVGSNRDDMAYGVATDLQGYVYVVGNTTGSFGYQNQGRNDAFIAKYAGWNGQLVWSRQLGTAGQETAYAVKTDDDLNVYVTGTTNGNLTRANAGGDDLFLAKFDPHGNKQFVTQWGSAGNDVPMGIDVTEFGTLTVVGFTNGSLAYDNQGGNDVFVAQYGKNGQQLWSRQLGSKGNEMAYGVSIDKDGTIYVAGSNDTAIHGGHFGGQDAFLAKYYANGDRAWIRHLGTTSNDRAKGVGVSADGVFIAGGTNGGTIGSSKLGGQDFFIAKFSN
jgi:hypothetical protein